MTPNLQLYNKAYEMLQGYGFPVISRKRDATRDSVSFFCNKNAGVKQK